MNYLLGIDLGTSGTKSVLFDENGKTVASSMIEYSIICPKNGWAEQNPEDWWDAVRVTVSKIISETDIGAESIAGIGISGQMHGLVMLDENGEVLRNCILWCDGRTSIECSEITETIGAKRLVEISANPALTGFTAGKVMWVKKNEPELYKKCKHILLPKDYIRYKLCGVFASEVSDASGTNLFDVTNRVWSDEILEKLDIDKSLMPKIYESCEVTGYVTEEAAKITGLAKNTPVVGGAADNMAAAVGTGVVTKGKAFTTLGTSGVVFAHADEVSIDKKGRVHTFCSAVPGKYTVMSCTLAAGLSLKWFRDNFCESEIATAKNMNVDPYYLMDKEAEQSPIGANRLLYLPYLMGERSPILDENARGVFFGLSGMHGKKDMIRSILEGVLYSQRNCIEVFSEMGITPETMLATGGGGSSKLWRQMMADVYGCPVNTIDNKEGPALGVAILAGVGTGIYNSIEEACEKVIQEKSQQEPIKNNIPEYTKMYNIYKNIYPNLKDNFSELSKL